jgi:hypothetical protein
MSSFVSSGEILFFLAKYLTSYASLAETRARSALPLFVLLSAILRLPFERNVVKFRAARREVK